jgi:hypothetical protein
MLVLLNLQEHIGVEGRCVWMRVAPRCKPEWKDLKFTISEHERFEGKRRHWIEAVAIVLVW